MIKTSKKYNTANYIKFLIKVGFKDCNNYILIDNSNTPDEKWNFVADHFHLDGRSFTHQMGMDNNVHVCEIWTDNKILSKTIE